MPRKPTSKDNTTATPQSNDQALQSAMAAHDLANSAIGVIMEFETMFEAIVELSTTGDRELICKLASLGMELSQLRIALFDAESSKHAKTVAECLKATATSTNTNNNANGGANV